MLCPKCGAEYRAGYVDCSNCQIPLVEGVAGLPRRRMDEMKFLAFSEFATAFLCLLLFLSASWTALPQSLTGIHFSVVMCAAAAVGYGALRRAPWVPKAAVILAAFSVALPNLSTVANLVGSVLSHGWAPATASHGVVILLGVSQLIPFVIGIRELQGRPVKPPL